jgi:hypothetical protein
MSVLFHRKQILLLAGDAVTLALVTLAGLMTHQEVSLLGIRLWPTFLPFLAAWLLVAPPMKIFDLKAAEDPRELWRPVWGMFLAAPLAGLLRSLWLGTLTVVTSFILVMGVLCALAILVWRSLYLILSRRMNPERV